MELLEDLGPEGKVLRHGTRLMITSQHIHVAREVDLQAEEEHADFEGEDTTIYVIAEEKKIGSAQSVEKDEQFLICSDNKHANLLRDAL